jgi:hypothetical protein
MILCLYDYTRLRLDQCFGVSIFYRSRLDMDMGMDGLGGRIWTLKTETAGA